MSVIDFHSHILPGIDDGSPHVEKSLEMLKMAKNQEVDIMVSTSHFYASRDKIDLFLARREKAYRNLQNEIKECGEELPNIRLGAEVAFFNGMSNAEGIEKLAIEGTNLLMIEMPFVPWSNRDLNEIHRLMKKKNVRVIIAHLERFMDYRRNKPLIEELLDMPVIVQVNAESLTDWKQRRRLVKMFKNHQAHILGSDCHGVNHRSPNLIEGRNVLEKKLGKKFLEKLDVESTALLDMTI